MSFDQFSSFLFTNMQWFLFLTKLFYRDFYPGSFLFFSDYNFLKLLITFFLWFLIIQRLMYFFKQAFLIHLFYFILLFYICKYFIKHFNHNSQQFFVIFLFYYNSCNIFFKLIYFCLLILFLINNYVFIIVTHSIFIENALILEHCSPEHTDSTIG